VVDDVVPREVGRGTPMVAMLFLHCQEVNTTSEVSRQQGRRPVPASSAGAASRPWMEGCGVRGKGAPQDFRMQGSGCVIIKIDEAGHGFSPDIYFCWMFYRISYPLSINIPLKYIISLLS
jgi:hypothetical protein